VEEVKSTGKKKTEKRSKLPLTARLSYGRNSLFVVLLYSPAFSPLVDPTPAFPAPLKTGGEKKSILTSLKERKLHFFVFIYLFINIFIITLII